MFAKVFSQIFDSSIADDPTVRYGFMDLLVLADSEGVIDMTPQAISRRTNVPLDTVISYISALSSPDFRSRSKEDDGARIKLLDSHRDWGWQIVNYKHYRELRDEESRRAYFRDRKKAQRMAEKAQNQMSKMSNSVHTCPPPSTDAEAEGSKRGVRAREEVALITQFVQELAQRLFKRSGAERPTYAEESAACLVLARSVWRSERDEILEFYGKLSSDAKRFAGAPKTLADLLQNWQETLDKARTYDPKAYEPKTDSHSNQQRFDRNKGNANEGKAHLYQVKKPIKTAV